ncbi:MAG: hypothetical protein ACKVKT_05560 [Rhodospirillales bacterium]|jgi:hypothetical protein
MNLDKGLIIVIILLAVVGAFVPMVAGYAPLAILIVGLVSGITSPLTELSDRAGYLLLAFAGPAVADSLQAIPVAGAPLDTIVGSVAIGAGGIWLASMTRAVVNRVMP